MMNSTLDIGLTHIALPVTDVDRSTEFYAQYAGMQVVHRRIDAETGVAVVWLSDRTRPFVIVLIQTGSLPTILSPLAHLGVGCQSRELIDALCQKAKQEGVLIQEPKDSGYPIGYWAFLRDPDGHTLELSYGQEIGLSTAAAPNPDQETDVAELIQRSTDSNAALMRGDIDTYQTLITYTDDFTLMSPFGGTPSRGSEYTPERMVAMGRFFKNGVFKQEVVQSYAVADMVVLVIIEHQNVEVGGLPAQEWPLRVTLVYCREGAEWRLAHRHADPLVEGISLEQAAALARGDTGRTIP